MNYIDREGRVHVALPLPEAMTMFTPEGERVWVPGWDPVYPSGEPCSDPGTVFVTHARGQATTWVIVELSEEAATYARVTPGVQAGTVSVRCSPDGAGTVARVRYRLTALDPAAERELREFDDGYEEFMALWERHVSGALAHG